MHELGIAIEIAERAAARADGAAVSRVVVEVGALTAVLPDALRFAWDMVADECGVGGARLDVIEIAGRGRCRACGTETGLRAVFGRCACGSELELMAGEELRIRELEVIDVRDVRM
jgi:hydrogenase nickel incorporation protein HypA/HybF